MTLAATMLLMVLAGCGCSAEEGEPLVLSFVEKGYEIDLTDIGVPVIMKVAGTGFAFRVKDYNVYSSDETHEALKD